MRADRSVDVCARNLRIAAHGRCVAGIARPTIHNGHVICRCSCRGHRISVAGPRCRSERSLTDCDLCPNWQGAQRETRQQLKEPFQRCTPCKDHFDLLEKTAKSETHKPTPTPSAGRFVVPIATASVITGWAVVRQHYSRHSDCLDLLVAPPYSALLVSGREVACRHASVTDGVPDTIFGEGNKNDMTNLSGIVEQLKKERDVVEKQLSALNAALHAFLRCPRKKVLVWRRGCKHVDSTRPHLDR